MPPNRKGRRVKGDAIGRRIIALKGDPNDVGGSSRRKALKASSAFNDMPHLHQKSTNLREVIEGGNVRAAEQKSCLERNTLDDFLEVSVNAAGAGNAVRLLVKQSAQQIGSQQELKGNSQKVQSASGYRENPLSSSITDASRLRSVVVPIPRRPLNYVSGKEVPIVSAAELTKAENESFLQWRIALAKMEEQEGFIMTPFERNLDFWRQLWRVLERSDIVLQILDARDPLFYRCCDLESYARELDARKEIVLLLNKSDLVPEDTRRNWAAWFRRQNVSCLFFSALNELLRLENEAPKANGDSEIKETENADASAAVSTEAARLLENSDYAFVDETLLENPEENFRAYLWRVGNEGRQVLSNTQLLTVFLCLKRIMLKTRLNELQQTQLRTAAHAVDIVNAAARCDSEPGPEPGPKDLGVDVDVQDYDNLDEAATLADVYRAQRREHRMTSRQKNELVTNTSQKEEQHSKFFTMKHNWVQKDLVIGMVGYPNVGKSSVINALLGCKVVSVSRQPGKTKHFQTLQLPIGVTLCDCPGLVFPQVVHTRAHLVLNGVSPVDVIRDFETPIQLIGEEVGLSTLLRHYGFAPAGFLRAAKEHKRFELISQDEARKLVGIGGCMQTQVKNRPPETKSPFDTKKGRNRLRKLQTKGGRTALKMIEISLRADERGSQHRTVFDDVLGDDGDDGDDESNGDNIPIVEIPLAENFELLKESSDPAPSYPLEKEQARKQIDKQLDLDPFDPRQFLAGFAMARGFIAGGKGELPDMYRAAKLVLRDYTTGKLPHAKQPPLELAC